MKIYSPRNVKELEKFEGELIRTRMNKSDETFRIRTFSGIKQINNGQFYEFLEQLVQVRKNGKFGAFNYIRGNLYSIEEVCADFDFSRKGVFLGCPQWNSDYDYGDPFDRHNFEKMKEMMSKNGSWKEVKGKISSIYEIPVTGSDEFYLHGVFLRLVED
ncbi:MAG: hypothetical protein AABX84_00090 [Nanoarchaeota archaeon]